MISMISSVKQRKNEDVPMVARCDSTLAALHHHVRRGLHRLPDDAVALAAPLPRPKVAETV
jgi:hypothetical protein